MEELVAVAVVLVEVLALPTVEYEAPMARLRESMRLPSAAAFVSSALHKLLHKSFWGFEIDGGNAWTAGR